MCDVISSIDEWLDVLDLGMHCTVEYSTLTSHVTHCTYNKICVYMQVEVLASTLLLDTFSPPPPPPPAHSITSLSEISAASPRRLLLRVLPLLSPPLSLDRLRRLDAHDPLPRHDGGGVNALLESSESEIEIARLAPRLLTLNQQVRPAGHQQPALLLGEPCENIRWKTCECHVDTEGHLGGELVDVLPARAARTRVGHLDRHTRDGELARRSELAHGSWMSSRRRRSCAEGSEERAVCGDGGWDGGAKTPRAYTEHTSHRRPAGGWSTASTQAPQHPA